MITIIPPGDFELFKSKWSIKLNKGKKHVFYDIKNEFRVKCFVREYSSVYQVHKTIYDQRVRFCKL
jgi:hypothetical protein